LPLHLFSIQEKEKVNREGQQKNKKGISMSSILLTLKNIDDLASH